VINPRIPSQPAQAFVANTGVVNPAAAKTAAANNAAANNAHPIAHYLLLPSYEWGIADWHLEVVRPFIKKHRPTLGFSLAEAAQAARVTVIGGEGCFAPVEIDRLRQAGCQVRQITGDGTIIATQLADA
jgi:16S rRNA U1498 N3-methylase RsmE